MRRLVTATQMRAIETASGEAGVPPSQLMESAGRRLADAALRLVAPNGQLIVVCGGGNNGGDGLVAARFLVAAGCNVKVELVGDPSKLKEDPARNLKALAASGIQPRTLPDNHSVGQGDVIIDAVFGTGLDRAPEGAYADAIRRMNVWRAAGAKIVAADLPSGLHSDTGQAFSPAVRADVTVSFGFYKLGQAVEPGASLCGELELVDIGIPGSCAQASPGPSAYLLEEDDVKARIPERKRDTHKGSYGHVLVVAGSWGKTGAAGLSAKAVLRSGAGLCTLATRPEALVPAMSHAPEVMGVELVSDGALSYADLNSILEAADGKTAVVMGPGMPRGDETLKLLGALLEELEVPVVLDADALNAIAEDTSVLSKAKCPLVLTPHPGEMARLVGRSTAAVQEARVDTARELATKHHATVVLKGARTIICSDEGASFVNPTGNPGMATAGTGDVLSGVIGGLLAQGMSPLNAALAAVFAHGLAGDLAAKRRGFLGLMASDVLESLSEVWVRWGR